MKNILGLALILGLASGAHAAQYVTTAHHTYFVDVHNQRFQEIWNAWVTVSEMGDYSAQVTVRAQGYQDVYGTVAINPAQRMVNVNVTMLDPTVQVQLVDATGAFIGGAFVDQNQFTADPSYYDVSIRLPSQGFTKFKSSDVRVDFGAGAMVNVWGQPNLPQIDIKIPRMSLGAGAFVWLRVTVPTDAQIAGHRRMLDRQRKFQKLYALGRPATATATTAR